MTRGRAIFTALAALTIGAGHAACSDNLVHPFSAWTFDVDRDCLLSPSVVDVLDGPDNGPCAQLRCWATPNNQFYVTDQACDAPADFTDETNDMNGVCAQAIAVFGRTDHGVCPDDGDAGTGGSSSFGL